MKCNKIFMFLIHESMPFHPINTNTEDQKYYDSYYTMPYEKYCADTVSNIFVTTRKIL